jgi:putative flippase GtrA
MPTTGNPPGARCGTVTTEAYRGKTSRPCGFGRYAHQVASNGPALIDRARGLLDVLIREMLKFGVVGAEAFLIDFGGYNVLVYGPHLQGMFDEQSTLGVLRDKPITAKILSATVATLVAWAGNRLWTFRHRRNRQASHELALFVLFNVIAMVISAGCLGISRYVFDLHTQLADNVTNLFGIALGTLFRFWSYRKFVFAGILVEEPLEPSAKS